ncbi:phosphoinositide phospholipase C 6-like isoform X3 [Apium graveolens]|uniref:phosphoinositide phospholipase C 6-like isoform X3 n=1 Tax=Apium graveolens TaxID=4045 RepID=UPI003D796AD5
MGSYNYYKMFGCFNRKFKMNEDGPPPDVVEAFSVYTQDDSQMSADQLLRFLVDFQGEAGYTLSMTEDLLHQVLARRHHLTKYTRNNLTLDDFYFFLFQDDLNPPINLQVHHDMTAPLQHYFIYTGHNSYLTGNQLSSDCSDIPIINALERGVRGIELDVWPNSAKDEIHVLHGRTLTTPVRLDKCFKSIKQHAFVKSSYPVIVTLEDHLTPSLREKVAEMAIEIFGELLYYPEPGCFDVFPSPQSLKHQIVLSTKPPKEYLDSIKPAKESLELKTVKVKNALKTKKTSGEDLSEKGSPGLTDEAETDQGKLEHNTDQDGDDDEVNNNTRDQVMDDEERGSESHKSSKELGPGFKRLFAMQSADLKVEPPNDLAEGCSTDTDLSSHLGETNEHAGLSGTDSHLRSQLEDSDEHAVPSCMNSHLSTHLRKTDEHAGLTSIDNRNYNQFSPLDGFEKDPSLDIQNSAQVKESDECAKDRNLENSKSSPLGTPEYKRLLAVQATDFKGDDEEEAVEDDEDVNKTQTKPSVYKRLIAIHAEKPKDGLRKTFIAEAEKVKRLSLSEHELARAAESYATDIVRFTQKNIVRVYPKGTRVTSSNFEPLQGWMVGAQMVAFNMQGYGKSLWLMHGMFRGNGGCGYVKKPEILMKRAPHEVFDPRATLPEKTTLKVKVYLGDGWRLDFSHTHFDTYSPPDFYTKMYIVGAPADFAKTKTKIIVDDWTPSWDEEFVFPLRVPELALLRIEVSEHDISDKDDFGGQTCLPVSELKPGIRAVPLYDRKGEKYKSVRLLMRFQFV